MSCTIGFSEDLQDRRRSEETTEFKGDSWNGNRFKISPPHKTKAGRRTRKKKQNDCQETNERSGSTLNGTEDVHFLTVEPKLRNFAPMASRLV